MSILKEIIVQSTPHFHILGPCFLFRITALNIQHHYLLLPLLKRIKFFKYDKKAVACMR